VRQFSQKRDRGITSEEIIAMWSLKMKIESGSRYL
jgi:hypothetical protein